MFLLMKFLFLLLGAGLRTVFGSEYPANHWLYEVGSVDISSKPYKGPYKIQKSHERGGCFIKS